jgi:protein gp37
MKNTSIQWCSSTCNPIMGCSGCELYPNPPQVLKQIDDAAASVGARINSRNILKTMISAHYTLILDPGPGHRNAVTTTNIWHFRQLLCEHIATHYGREAGSLGLNAIEKSLTCYAAKLHLNRGANILKPDRGLNTGYAPTFEQLAAFGGRMAEAAGWSDLLGAKNPEKPWMHALPRMIFVSDMGDALSSNKHFPFLKREFTDSIKTVSGMRHLWLWLTKRPENMRHFADVIGGLPGNVCAMTTVTSPETLHRVDQLRQVDATCRGLSIEPLWERLPPERLDLTGIDWVIVGGESGSGSTTRPFHTEWAEELHDHCHKHRVAFFLKQLGRNPISVGKPIRLSDPHGGDWDEWPRHLRIREFPAYFRNFRSSEPMIARK